MSEKQSSLTSPNDKSVANYIPNSKPSLNDEDTQRAFKECFISSLNDIAYERKYADPRIPGQIYSLHSFIPSKDRLITIEDVAEVQLIHEHHVQLETFNSTKPEEPAVGMDSLLKNTLRMRPDRIIVGEVRGPEAKTLFTAMNTGHDGCFGTVHANTAQETVSRLINPPMEVPPIMMNALHLIVMQSRIAVGGKQVRTIT